MADDREIEGSAARIRDRGQPFGLEAFAADPGDRLSLGSREDVETILRGFMAAVPDVARTGGEAGLDSLCASTADIFYGRYPDLYAPMGTFNSPAVLGARLKSAYGVDVEPETAAAVFLLNTATQVMAAMIEHADGDADDERLSYLLDSTLDEAVTAMMGLPPSASDED